MAILDLVLSPYTPVVVAVALVLYYAVPYFTTNKALRDIPAPPGAAWSNLWLLLQCRQGSRYAAVDKAHKELNSKLVRIQPDHVSVADVDAIQAIYGHGNGFLKSEYYDAFVSIRRGLFNTRDRAEHTRKRKIVSHTFAPKNVLQFEEYQHHNLQTFVRQWDRISETGPEKYGKLDALQWYNYLAFDIIGDLAFGAPFGMLENGRDIAEIRETADGPSSFVAAVEVINRRGEVSGTLGCLPALKPYAKYSPDPFFSKGVKAVEDLKGIAIARVSARLAAGDNNRVDLLARLMQGKDTHGAPLGREELTAEALTQLIAGSDTTSNTSCAILYWVLKTPGIIEKLQKELDAVIPPGVSIPQYETVKDLPYMHRVINETLRIHSTSSLGLPRLVPDGPGITIAGHYFPAGTVLSVPAYTIHHSKEVWGPDADEFNPDRWEDDRLTETQKNAFIPFSYGPRSCVGRNLAEMELTLIVATTFRRYEFEMYQDYMDTREGFLRKPVSLMVGVKKRANI